MSYKKGRNKKMYTLFLGRKGSMGLVWFLRIPFLVQILPRTGTLSDKDHDLAKHR